MARSASIDVAQYLTAKRLHSVAQGRAAHPGLAVELNAYGVSDRSKLRSDVSKHVLARHNSRPHGNLSQRSIARGAGQIKQHEVGDAARFN